MLLLFVKVLVIEIFSMLAEVSQPCIRFTVGQRVRLESGPLRGLQGFLSRVGNSKRVVVSVVSISSSVSVTLSDTIITVFNK